jgi:cell division protein WhiA
VTTPQALSTETEELQAELSAVQVVKACCRKAEISTLLRLTGGLYLTGGRVIIEAELPTAAAARRLQAGIAHTFRCRAEILVSHSALGDRHLLRVGAGTAGATLARQTGLIDGAGRLVRGLPRPVIGGDTCCCEAAWRAALIAKGSLTGMGRSTALEVTCSEHEAALALVGLARRMKTQAKVREVRGLYRAVARDDDATAILARLGACQAQQAMEDRRERLATTWAQAPRAARNPANLDQANVSRSTWAAAVAAARAERALEILGDDVPGELAAAGRLRMAHRQATLGELGALAAPAVSKDAMAGRIRRLLAQADRRATERGIPGTQAALTGPAAPGRTLNWEGSQIR